MSEKKALSATESISYVRNTNKKLTVSNNATIQPISLMRLGVFVPKPKRIKSYMAGQTSIDVTDTLGKLEIARSEGYDNIVIVGDRLDMEIDFKVWVGIIHAFSKYGLTSNTIQLKYTEFAKLCGFPIERLRNRLKESIKESLFKIAGKKLRFTQRSHEGKAYVTSLLYSGELNPETNIVVLSADPKLWELFQFDNKVLLQLSIISKLQKKESAQALYTFIESLPRNPAPLSFERIRERLQLTSNKASQNIIINKAINALMKIGYLEGSVCKRHNEKEQSLIIYNRCTNY